MSTSQPPNGPNDFGHRPNPGPDQQSYPQHGGGMGAGPQQPYPQQSYAQQGYPQQGYPQPRKKRRGCLIAALVATALAIVVLASCVSGLNNLASGPEVTPASGGGNPSTPQNSPTAPTTYAVGQPIQIGDVVMTVNSSQEFTPDNEFEKPNSGRIYYSVNLTLENKGSTPVSYNAYDYKIEDADGVQTDQAFVTSVENAMSSGSLAPGGKLNGVNVVYEVPVEKKELKFIAEPSPWSNKQVKVKLTD